MSNTIRMTNSQRVRGVMSTQYSLKKKNNSPVQYNMVVTGYCAE